MSDPQSAIGAPAQAGHPQSRIAVVGGGISGMAAANRLIELGLLDVTLFEAGPRIGGVVGTQHRDGYLIERGPDMFVTDKPWAVDLCRRLGLEDELIPTDNTFRRSLVLRKGKPVPVPEGFMLLSPAKVWPVLASPIFSPLGKLRMGCEYFIPRRTGNGDESLASFVRRRFGREALDRLVQPLVGGIYTADPEQLSLQATLPRFLDMEREHRSLIRASKKIASQRAAESTGSGARYGLFTTLRDGLGRLFDVLRGRIEAAGTVRINTPVVGVHASACPVDRATYVNTRTHELQRGWTLDFADGTTEFFDAVILACRAFQAADILNEVDAELAAELRLIEYATTAVVVSGHKLADIAHPMDAFGLVIPAIEHRKLLAVSFSSRKFPNRAPQDRILLRTFVGGALQPELMELSDAELTAVVQSELSEMLGVRGEPDFIEVVRYDKAMPQYHVGHLDRVARIEALAAKHAGLALAGNAFRGVGLPDCIHSGEQAAGAVSVNLPRGAGLPSGNNIRGPSDAPMFQQPIDQAGSQGPG